MEQLLLCELSRSETQKPWIMNSMQHSAELNSETCSPYIYLIKSQTLGFVKRTKPHHNLVFLSINRTALVLITVIFILTRSSASLQCFLLNSKLQTPEQSKSEYIF